MSKHVDGHNNDRWDMVNFILQYNPMVVASENDKILH